MTLAVIDIGTNTVRALIRNEAGDLERVEHVTGLGRGVDATGLLAPEAIDRTLSALRRVADRIGAGATIRVVATSASRDAANRSEFFEAVEAVVGREPELLDGLEEAHLSFAGATREVGTGLTTVVDLGGGSTEIITGRGSPTFARSYDIGSVRVTDRHFGERPAPAAALRRAADDIRSTVRPVPDEAGTLVGVGGTFQTLGLVVGGSRHGVELELNVLEQWVERLAAMSLEETARLAGVAAERAIVLLGGTLVAATVVAVLGASKISVSERDLLDGMMAELVLAQSPG